MEDATLEDVVRALEANYLVNSRIYDLLLWQIYQDHPDEALEIDELHDKGLSVMSDIVFWRNSE